MRIKGDPLHPECFKCVKCGKSLKNQGLSATDSVVNAVLLFCIERYYRTDAYSALLTFNEYY